MSVTEELAATRRHMEVTRVGELQPYRWKDWTPKDRAARNRRMDKMKREQLTSAIDAHDRILAVSTEIRAKVGLPPVVDGETMTAARARLDSLPVGRAPRKAKATSAAPVDPLAELAKRRRALEREREAIDALVVELVESKAAPVSKIAAALGVSRQRVYQLAG